MEFIGILVEASVHISAWQWARFICKLVAILVGGSNSGITAYLKIFTLASSVMVYLALKCLQTKVSALDMVSAVKVFFPKPCNNSLC